MWSHAHASGAKPPVKIINYIKEGLIMVNKNSNEKTMRDIVIVYSPRMAGYLMMRGFYLIGVQPNKKHPDKNCFSFFESPMLRDAMEDYINRTVTV